MNHLGIYRKVEIRRTAPQRRWKHWNCDRHAAREYEKKTSATQGESVDFHICNTSSAGTPVLRVVVVSGGWQLLRQKCSYSLRGVTKMICADLCWRGQRWRLRTPPQREHDSVAEHGAVTNEPTVGQAAAAATVRYWSEMLLFHWFYNLWIRSRLGGVTVIIQLK